MARSWRLRMRRGVLYMVVAGLISGMTFGAHASELVQPPRAPGAPGANDALPRVRSSSPAIRSLLTEASSRSATFAGLIQTIERTDGIVYVEPGVCRHGVRACLSLTVTPASGFRILRVIVDLTTSVIELMATIGHELRHALEILTEPSVRSTTAAYLFYTREAPTTHGFFETAAAIQAGYAVERELGRRAGLR